MIPPSRIRGIPVIKAASYGVKIVCNQKGSQSQLLVTDTDQPELLTGREFYSGVSFIYVGYSLCGLVNAFVCMLMCVVMYV